MRQPAGRLARIRAAIAPRGEMLHCSAQCRRLAHEAAALPVDEVDVRVDLCDAIFAGLPRTIAADALQPALAQAPDERAFETIPRRREHRQERRAGEPRQALARPPSPPTPPHPPLPHPQLPLLLPPPPPTSL